MSRTDESTEGEKAAAALSAMVTAVFITTMKVVVGILAEAADSGLDLIVGILTFSQCKLPCRPSLPKSLLLLGKVCQPSFYQRSTRLGHHLCHHLVTTPRRKY